MGGWGNSWNSWGSHVEVKKSEGHTYTYTYSAVFLLKKFEIVEKPMLHSIKLD